jgi:glycine hydroxymethyltransferase
LILVDLTQANVTGVEAERKLEAVGITVNKNAIPFDPRKPGIASGIRIGTPAVTTRGFGPSEMKTLAEDMVRVIQSIGTKDEGPVSAEVKAHIRQWCERFPLYAS